VTDANGDGKRTLRMYAANGKSIRRMPDGSIKQLARGDQMLDLEVTRVSRDGLTIQYKDHAMDLLDSIKAPHRGWPYHRQILKNESGSKTWVSKFPGDAYHLSVAGRKLRAGDFPDTDRNGRAMVRLYDFGAGDRVRVPTHFYLRRLKGQDYAFRADVGFTMTLKAKALMIREPGKKWKDVPGRPAGNLKTFSVEAAMLGSGRGELRVIR